MDDLRTIPLFRAIPLAEFRQLESASERHAFKRGQVLFEEGQPAEHVWIIKRGWVSLVKRAPGGGHATIFVMTPDEAICGLSAFEHERYSATAISASDVQVLKLPASVFSSWIDRYPAFAHEVVRTCCQRIRRMAEAISLAHTPVEHRIAYMLLRLRTSFGDTIPLTHQELARMIGARWETSIRTLSLMKRRGWVRSTRGRMTILQAKRLRALLTNGHSAPAIPSTSARRSS